MKTRISIIALLFAISVNAQTKPAANQNNATKTDVKVFTGLLTGVNCSDNCELTIQEGADSPVVDVVIINKINSPVKDLIISGDTSDHPTFNPKYQNKPAKVTCRIQNKKYYVTKIEWLKNLPKSMTNDMD